MKNFLLLFFRGRVQMGTMIRYNRLLVISIKLFFIIVTIILIIQKNFLIKIHLKNFMKKKKHNFIKDLSNRH